MLRLSKRSGLCPQCLMVKNVKRLGDFPVSGGGFGDVWKGKIGEQVVCLKVVKVYLVSDVQQLLQEYMQEAIVWQQLKHPNLLPFMGMFYLDKGQEQLCLVSPWMERGNLVKYLKVMPREQVDHYSLVYDVASGLTYLHDKKIVHGDLKGFNILITPDERACIGDFGLSHVADTHALRLTTSTVTPSKGTTRWLSPELLKSEPPCTSSTFSDIYAFACVCYEIFTGNVPFYELVDGAVIVAVLLDKKHPSRPNLTMLNDTMWNTMVNCWQNNPQVRPSAFEVLECVAGINNPKTGGRTKPAGPWDIHHFKETGGSCCCGIDCSLSRRTREGLCTRCVGYGVYEAPG
ncbi:kinase-like protein [Marasmius fiardii PR-910]|nr:kinase-like protein [Marasmius fiardii PR-910]